MDLIINIIFIIFNYWRLKTFWFDDKYYFFYFYWLGHLVTRLNFTRLIFTKSKVLQKFSQDRKSLFTFSIMWNPTPSLWLTTKINSCITFSKKNLPITLQTLKKFYLRIMKLKFLFLILKKMIVVLPVWVAAFNKWNFYLKKIQLI